MSAYIPGWAVAFPEPHDNADAYIDRATGPRRTLDDVARCYSCGADVPDGPRFGHEATCDDCARKGDTHRRRR